MDIRQLITLPELLGDGRISSTFLALINHVDDGAIH